MGSEYAPTISTPSPAPTTQTVSPRPVQSSAQSLPGPLQQAFESVSGISLDDVTVRYNSSLPSQIGALAYTQGTRIHLGPSQEHHLAHEAWHTVQQLQRRVTPMTTLAGQPVNTDPRLESEADRMSSQASRIMRATYELASPTAPAEARIRRSPLARSRSAGVIQGVWSGLSADEAEFASYDPIGVLLAWAQRRQSQLDGGALQGAHVLAAAQEHPQARASILHYLEDTLASGDGFSPDHLLRQVPAHSGAFAQDSARLDGPAGDHVEDDHAPAAEVPISLHNLDHIVLDEIRDDDPVLLVIGQRILREYPDVPHPGGLQVKVWLQLLQTALIKTDVDTVLESDDEWGDNEYGGLDRDAGDEGIIQGAFRPGTVSGPKTYVAANGFAYTGVSYTRDASGSIDFGAPTAQTAWANPMTGAVVALATGATAANKGLLQNGNEVVLKRANRNQHFDIANRIVGNGLAGVSPPGRTWHHLLTRYDMVLVDRTVHMQHGHNGGVLIW